MPVSKEQEGMLLGWAGMQLCASFIVESASLLHRGAFPLSPGPWAPFQESPCKATLTQQDYDIILATLSPDFQEMYHNPCECFEP